MKQSLRVGRLPRFPCSWGVISRARAAKLILLYGPGQGHQGEVLVFTEFELSNAFRLILHLILRCCVAGEELSVDWQRAEQKVEWCEQSLVPLDHHERAQAEGRLMDEQAI